MVPAIEKADSIFTYLMHHPEGASLKEISTTLDIPKSTAHRMLLSLSYFDYLEQEGESGRYTLGPKLLSLSRAAEQKLNLNRIAVPFLEELAKETEETVKLSVIRHQKIYVINTVLSPRQMKITVETGAVFPPHIGAASKLLLASLPDEEIEHYLSHKLEAYTTHSIVEADKLRRTIAAIRKEMIARDGEEETLGISGVAAPVKDSFGDWIAAVSIPYITAFRSDKELIPPLERCVSGISGRLGYIQT